MGNRIYRLTIFAQGSKKLFAQVNADKENRLVEIKWRCVRRGEYYVFIYIYCLIPRDLLADDPYPKRSSC